MTMSFTAEQRLHDRATRGEVLSPAEQGELARWYAEIDQQQSQVLFCQDQPPALDPSDQDRLARLRQQVDELLTQLQITTQRLQQVSAQNQVLRNEISLLRTKVAERGLLEAA